MATITTRSGKGSPLTNNEVDANFTNLNTDKVELDDISASTASASGTGSLAYSNASGVFTYTPPVLLTASSSNTFTNKSGAISQWTNDSGYAAVSANNDFTGSNNFTGGLESEGAGSSSVRIGAGAGGTNQGSAAVSIGNSAGLTGQDEKSVAIGQQAGKTNQGSRSLAIGVSAGKTNQGNKGIIISSSNVAVDDTTDSHVHIANDEASLDYTSAAGWSFVSTVSASNKLSGNLFSSASTELTSSGVLVSSVTTFFGVTFQNLYVSDMYWYVPNVSPARIAMKLERANGNLTVEGTVTAAGSALISVAQLKTEVAASADFAAFKSRIAAL